MVFERAIAESSAFYRGGVLALAALFTLR